MKRLLLLLVLGIAATGADEQSGAVHQAVFRSPQIAESWQRIAGAAPAPRQTICDSSDITVNPSWCKVSPQMPLSSFFVARTVYILTVLLCIAHLFFCYD